jgi:5-methylcytosine-specific restriction endonuclease McrA
VFERDGERCAYRDERGERCRETLGLEIHHRCAYALGGPSTLDNLELRCRPHNALAAEEDFGREHMDLARGGVPEMRP